MTDISFNIESEIIIGTDIINRTGTICTTYGNRVLLISDQTVRENKATERLIAILQDSGIEAILFDAVPDLAMADTAEAAAVLARAARCSTIIGFGSIIAQAIARMTAIITYAAFDIFDLLDGKTSDTNLLPYIAIPSVKEDPFLLATSFIAIDPRDRSIKQLKAPKGLCKASIMDSNFSLGNASIALSAFDGFCVAVEAYCSKKNNFFSEPLLEDAIALYAEVIAASVTNNNEEKEEKIIKAAVLTGLGVAVSSVGIGSTLAYSIAGRFPVTKSLCAAALLPAILEKLICIRPEKMARVAALMGEKVEVLSVADAAALPAASIRRSLESLNIATHLQSLGLDLDRLVPITESVRKLDMVAFSPWTVTSEAILDMVKQSF